MVNLHQAYLAYRICNDLPQPQFNIDILRKVENAVRLESFSILKFFVYGCIFRYLMALQYLRICVHKVSKKAFQLTQIRLESSNKSQECDLDKCYEAINQIVGKGGEFIRLENFNPKKQFETKSSHIDLITTSDKKVEEYLISNLQKQFPSHRFIGEEETSEKGSPVQLTNDPTWIIDPIDGTMNFVHSYPHSCISAALVVNKVTELGIIYNPSLQQRFTARRGQGACYNGRPIKVSGQKKLSLALTTSGICISRDSAEMKVAFENFARIAKLSHGLRFLGTTALHLAMVALGAVDANYEFGPHAWDMCAGVLMVREAGGVVMDPAGGEFDLMSRRVLAAATPELAHELGKTLTQFYLPRDDGVK